MGQFLLVLVVAIVAAAIVFGVVTMINDADAGLAPVEPDGRAVPLPGTRPLAETDVAALRFDTTLRGYRMEQVDQALRRAAYDIGYKDELITVLEAEVEALRGDRRDEADELRAARRRSAIPTEESPVELDDAAPADPATVEPAVTPGERAATVDEDGLAAADEADTDALSASDDTDALSASDGTDALSASEDADAPGGSAGTDASGEPTDGAAVAGAGRAGADPRR
jgi:DivIVA domain-containing protein